MPRVYTGGTFDLFHAGHIELLEYCAHLSNTDEVIVGLNTDEFVEKFKGSLPIMSYKERETLLWSCRFVNDVIPNTGGEDSKPAILVAQPDIIAIGMDWLEKDYLDQLQIDEVFLNENKIALIYIPRTTGVSTTKIKQRI